MQPGDQCVIDREGFGRLLDALKTSGYQVMGPILRDGAIVYDEISSADDLPAGWTDEQAPGAYHLRRGDGALFGYTVGPYSWKRFLHPPAVRLWHARRHSGDVQVTAQTEETPRVAFVGVRACELHAIAIQDRVFLQGPYADPVYRARRERLFIVAVNCGQAGGTCFCASMRTGPRATSGFDLALTELLADGRHEFLVEVGTPRGAAVLEEIPARAATGADREAAAQILEMTTAQMGRQMDTADLPDLLYRNYEHPRWQEIAARCLCCGNCTMVCPTCFCTAVEESADLDGQHVERWRRWDSCFTLAFSYMHGGSVRASAAARYRQWLTHKLATWIDQFGTSGCVGCGRCITWCPVGIDITEEVRAIRGAARAGPEDAGREGSHADA